MYLQLNYASSNVKVDSLTFISFQENYQTAEIYFYSYHVIPLNKTISTKTLWERIFGRGWTNRMFEVCYVYEGYVGSLLVLHIWGVSLDVGS